MTRYIVGRHGKVLGMSAFWVRQVTRRWEQQVNNNVKCTPNLPTKNLLAKIC